jgi:UPF0755 protein
MGLIISVIRFIFNFILFLTGSLALVIIAALLYGHNLLDNDSQILIRTGSAPFRTLLDAEARELYPILQARADEINRPFSNDPGLVSFTIEAGETALTVADRLRALGLIHDAELFGQLLRYNGLDTRLQTGSYQLRRNMTMREIGAALYQGYSARGVVRVPPGWRMEQLAEHLAVTETMDGYQFLRRAREGTGIDHYLLADRPPGQSYEGYLFPGTYILPEDSSPEMLIAQMINHMASRLPANSFELARQRGLTFYQVLILASIVEREAVLPEERPLIASVYLNRLNPDNAEIYLRADPTVQYAMGYQRDTGQWWKSPVRLEEYPLVDSPYNTYLYPGLPPGPIASPGLESIMAVLQPAQTDYLFFVCRRPRCEGGAHAFARTYEEHLQNVAVYWGE